MDELFADELLRLLRKHSWYEMTNVHTSFPGVVESYDPATRRADIQPSLKRKMPDGEFLAWPVIPNVPVRFQGSKKYTIHFPLEKGDEVEVTVCERSTDAWRTSGGKDIEDGDLRRFALADCYCSPGLQPVEFIAVEEEGLNIVHKTGYDGDFVSSITMDDDKVQIKYKEKAEVMVEDDHINAKTEKCAADLTGDVAELKNSQASIKAKGSKISVKNGSLSLFTILDDLLKALQNTHPTSMGSPANHEFNPAITQAIATADQGVNGLLEA
jgi:hypothetical protein